VHLSFTTQNTFQCILSGFQEQHLQVFYNLLTTFCAASNFQQENNTLTDTACRTSQLSGLSLALVKEMEHVESLRIDDTAQLWQWKLQQTRLQVSSDELFVTVSQPDAQTVDTINKT
jgi:hypothetical protein